MDRFDLNGAQWALLTLTIGRMKGFAGGDTANPLHSPTKHLHICCKQAPRKKQLEMHVIVQLVVLNRYVPFWDIVYFWYTYYAIWVILNLWQTIWRVWTYDPTGKMTTRNYLLFKRYNSPPVLFLEYNGHMAVHLLLLSCLLAKCFSWLGGRVCVWPPTNKAPV